MNLDNKMKNYKKQTEAKSREDKILDTIRKSKETFYEKEQARMLTYWEFLWTQVRMIQKKWWLLQTLLLICVGFTIPGMEDDFFVQRSMGVAGVLFVVLVIPELWKNRTNHCMEIEAASFYSLRQISGKKYRRGSLPLRRSLRRKRTSSETAVFLCICKYSGSH